jgi:pectinesterase
MLLNFTPDLFARKTLLLRTLVAALFIFVCGSVSAQQIAFPGAEGAGRFTSGGRGTVATPTTVFEVTNLNDDNNAGSLRYALQASTTTYPYRTIVFKVSGTIHLTSKLTIKGNTTIAGQTAPGGGICLADYPVVISGDNVILRYIRVRMGDKNQNGGMVDGSGGDDALGNLGNKNIIIDHCSVSWSDDEALTIYRGDSISVQWNIISEPLNYSYHFETGDADFEHHGYGGIWGGKRASFHHNLLAHIQGRAPRFDGSRNLPPYTAGQENVDFRNNVIYDWGSYNVNGGEGGNYNIVNNYYKWGPSTASGNSSGVSIRAEVINPGKQTTSPVLPYGKYYLSGNYVDGSASVTANNWLGAAMSAGTQADTASSKVTTAFDIAPLAVESATDAYNSVLQKAGARFPSRDTLDQRILGDVTNRTGKVIDVQGGYPHGTAYSSTTGAWPTLATTAAPADDDHDGMSNAWELAKGLNPNDPSDRGIVTANGYTNLENYLNGLAEFSVTTTGTIAAFGQNIGTPSPVRTYSVSAANVAGNLTITPPAPFEVSLNGTTWFNSASPLTVTPVGGTIASTNISVRLNASAAGSYSGNLLHSSAGSVPVSIPLSGIASTVPTGISVIVAQDGSGNFTTVQAAIDAAPANATSAYVIFIKNGKYKEKIVVPANKPFIQLLGESVANTIITYNDGASNVLPGGGTVGTFNSYTLLVSANDFSALNITFENSFGDGSQAVAVHLAGDRAAFKNCRFLGNQDTMLNNGNAGLRQYFKNCYIDGNVDFIFGSARVVFDSCVIYAKTRTSAGSSFITAANTQAGQAYGYVFRNCTIPANTGGTTYYLGRPWQNSTGSVPFANNKVVFLNTSMGYTVRPEGWVTWDAGTNTSLIYYGEYKSKNMDGTLANTSSRVSWSNQLSDADAATYTNANLFGSWDPCTVTLDFCNPNARDIAISNFRGTKGTTNTTLAWNPSWAMSGIKFELYRSASRTSGYTKIGEVTSVSDTAYNFQLTDALPAAGNSYYYYLTGSKTSMTTNVSDTLQISSISTITTSGTLSAFTQNYGTPSAAQTFSVSGSNLVDDITITPPANYEVSVNNTTWFNSTTPLVLTQTANSVPATNISVRLNAPALGTFAGNILLTSNSATPVTVAVTGTTSIIPPPSVVTLEQWPMNLSNADSALVRSPGVAGTTPTLVRLVVSNGTTVATVPAYSPTNGQAFGVTALGEWGTAVGGPGGNLNRNIYEQFTVTANAGYSVRVDSIALNAAFYNTSSNTKLAIVYSKTNFTTNDSTDVTGGVGLGTPLLSTANGAFATPVFLANQTTGTTNAYSFALAGATGITLTAGQTLTIRMYFSCGSTSTGRYGLIKNVRAIGQAINLAAPPTITTAGTLTSFTQLLGTPSAVQTYTVSGTNLTGNILVAPPTNFELSLDGVNWNGPLSPLVLTPVSGTLAATTISVRLNAATLGASSGNITHLSSGATTVNVAVSGVTNPPPGITVVGTLNPFSQTVGAPSAVQTYTIAGVNLTNNITITPRLNYQVSADGGATWFGNATPLVLTQTGGNVPTTTISVRLNAAAPGTYSGNITNTSGAATTNVAVTGVTVAAPAITVTGTLSAFSQIIGTPSAVQTYTLSGSNLTGNITITPPANYQVSSDGGTTWFTNASPLVLTQSSGSVATTTISVRLNATTAGTYSGNVVHVTSGGSNVNVAVTGTAVLPPTLTATGTLTAFAQTIGNPSAVQTYTIAGANLTSNVLINPPANYQVSLDGNTWFSNGTPLTLTPVAGVLATTTIRVRLNATTAGTFAGNITNSSTGAATVNTAVTGTAVFPPSITAVGTPTPFIQTGNTPSAAQTFTVSGNSLTANLVIAPPPFYEISLDGTTWNAIGVPITLTPTSGTVATTTIYIRLHASFTGTFNGNIIISSTGAVSANIAVTGINTFGNRYVLYPNPVYRNLFFAHPQTTDAGTLTFYNTAGMRLMVISTGAGTTETNIDVSRLPAGVYIVEYRNGDQKVDMKLIKE